MSSLCARCEQLFDLAAETFANPGEILGKSRDFDDYQTWVQNAEPLTCGLCAILSSLKPPDDMQTFLDPDSDNAIRVDCSFDSEEKTSVAMEIKAYSTSIMPTIYRPEVQFWQTKPPLPPSTSKASATWSWQSIKLVKKWLRNCLLRHSACQGPPQPQRLPLRFLDVDPKGDVQKRMPNVNRTKDIALLSLRRMPGVKLCSSEGLPLNVPYLTLSHCWGRSPVLQLRNDNLAQFSRSIDSRELLKPAAATFRDAIHVTRCLGFRYLWIDALCINQDDEAEKSTEIIYMDQIYSYSALNLSATEAEDGSGGLSFDRNPLIVEPCSSKRHPNLVASLCLEDLMASEMPDSPISKRSWIFQERVLATKVLHFCRRFLFWECRTTQEHEPIGQDRPPSEQDYFPLKERFLPHGSDGSLTPRSGQAFWSDLIYDYSTTSLTFPGDTLLALSATSSVICTQRRLKPEDYAAGLWIPEMPHALAWNVKQDEFTYGTKPPRTTAEYVAPSWSWAALFCSVQHLNEPYGQVLVHDIHASINLRTENRFGSVLGGSLSLRGRLGLLHFQESENGFRMRNHDDLPRSILSVGYSGADIEGLTKRVCRLVQDDEDMPSLDDDALYQRYSSEVYVLRCEWDYTIPSGDQSPYRTPLRLPDGHQLCTDTTRFFLLPLGIRFETYLPGNPKVEGLILHRCSEKGEYARLGMFCYNGPGRYQSDYILDLLFNNDGLEDDLFLSRHDDGTGTIRII